MEKLYKITDGSYCLAIGLDQLEHKRGISLLHQKYRELAFAENLPADNTQTPKGYSREVNNCIMQNIKSGQILFTQKRFLEQINEPNFCDKCGTCLHS